jgi:hypothetical protein
LTTEYFGRIKAMKGKMSEINYRRLQSAGELKISDRFLPPPADFSLRSDEK